MIEFWESTQVIQPVLYLNSVLPDPKTLLIMQIMVGMLMLLLARLVFLNRFNTRLYSSILLISACAIQTSQYFFYCGYFDEVYVNLEHTWNLYHFGKFSFSPHKMVDGTVEFIYYLILLPFAGSHSSLVMSCIILGWIVSLLHTVIVWRLTMELSMFFRTLIILIFAWNPVFAEIQGAGFGNGLVSLFYLLGFYQLWRNNWRYASIVAAILPAFRPDSVLYSACLIVGLVFQFRKIPFAAILGAITSSSIFLLATKFMYGHWILTPVLFKKTPIHKIFSSDLISQTKKALYGLCDPYILSILVVLTFSIFLSQLNVKSVISRIQSNIIRVQFVLVFLVYLFYVLTGRHYAAETRRYYLPFEYMGVFLVASEWGLGYLFSRLKNQFNFSVQFSDEQISSIERFVVSLTLFCLFCWCETSAFSRYRNLNYSRYWRSNNSGFEWSLAREDTFSGAARIAKATVPLDWKIATTELNGFGFLLDNDIDPLYGYANRRFAESNIMSAKISKIKTVPDYLEISKPEVIWLPINEELSFLAFEGQNQSYFYYLLCQDIGIPIEYLLTNYTKMFVIYHTEGKKLDLMAVLVRKDLTDKFAENIKTSGFKKKQHEVPYATEELLQWQKNNPFLYEKIK